MTADPTAASAAAPPPLPAPPVVWGLSEGYAGMETQIQGLAAALGWPLIMKRVRARLPWDWLPGRLWPCPLKALNADSDVLAPPWPDLVISTSNVAAPIAVALKRASGGRSRLIHLQNPKLALSRFDLVIAPRHDGLSGANVIETKAGLHRVTPPMLATAAAAWAGRFAAYPRPLVGVFLGGASRRFKLDAKVGHDLGVQVAAAVAGLGGAVLASASRRTAPAAYAGFRAGLGAVPGFAWDGQGDNPYLASLGTADHLIITADSVSMLSEALATGRPVHVARLPGRSHRLGLFVEELVKDGYVRWFDGTLPVWSYPPLDEMSRVAGLVRARLGLIPPP